MKQIVGGLEQLPEVEELLVEPLVVPGGADGFLERVESGLCPGAGRYTMSRASRKIQSGTVYRGRAPPELQLLSWASNQQNVLFVFRPL